MNLLASALRKIVVSLDRRHWAVLILAAPFLLFPSPVCSPVLAVVPGLWILAWLLRRRALPRTPFNLTLLMMAVMVLVSEYATYDLAFSLPKIAGMVFGLGVFFAMARAGESPAGWWLGLCTFLLMGVAIAGLGLFGTNWSSGKFAWLAPITLRLAPRITGLPGAEPGFSANELAGALVWVLPLWLVLAALVWRRARGLDSALGCWRTVALVSLVSIAALFIAGILVLTQSRGGYLGLAVALAAMLFVMMPARARVPIVILIGLAILVSGVLFSNVVLGLLTGLPGDELDAPGASALETVKGRMEVWSRAVYGLQDFMFTGMGMNTFRRVVHVLYPLFLIGPDAEISHAHNEFLQAGLDLGIPGLIAFVALYLGAFGMLVWTWRAVEWVEGKAWVRAIGLGLGGGLLAHIVYGMTDAVTLGAKPGFLFWMLLALVATLFGYVRAGRVAQFAEWLEQIAGVRYD